MPIVLTVEDGTGSNPAANTFVSLADADAYHAGVVESTEWDTATEDEKNRSLAQATRILGSQFTWQGERAHPDTQPLVWPRTGVKVECRTVASDVVPREVREATSEVARELLAAGGFQTRPPGAGGADQLKGIELGKGALKIEYQDQAESAASGNENKTAVTPYVVELLRPFASFNQQGDRIVKVYR